MIDWVLGSIELLAEVIIWRSKSNEVVKNYKTFLFRWSFALSYKLKIFEGNAVLFGF